MNGRETTPARSSKRWHDWINLRILLWVGISGPAGPPEYKALVEKHQRFHAAAAGVVDMADSGKQVSADLALGSGSAYTSASREVVSAIVALQKRLKAG